MFLCLINLPVCIFLKKGGGGETEIYRGETWNLPDFLHKGREYRNPSYLQGSLSPSGRCYQDGSLSVAGFDLSTPSTFTSTHRCLHPTMSTTAGFQPDRSQNVMRESIALCSAVG